MLIVRPKPSARSTSFFAALMIVAALSGCAGKLAVLPEEGRTMIEIYQDHVGDAGADALDAARLERLGLAAEASVDSAPYTRTAYNEIEALFVRLPNPDLVMYVFPHLVTEEGLPIPGYSTVFPMYERVIYALPGETP